MSDTGWLILAVAGGVLAAFLWVRRELWLRRGGRQGRGGGQGGGPGLSGSVGLARGPRRRRGPPPPECGSGQASPDQQGQGCDGAAHYRGDMGHACGPRGQDPARDTETDQTYGSSHEYDTSAQSTGKPHASRRSRVPCAPSTEDVAEIGNRGRARTPPAWENLLGQAFPFFSF